MKFSNQTISNTLGTARIIATLGIFSFHILGLHGINNKNIDFICIIIFCTLSGFYIPEITNGDWLKNKFIKILLPYIIIIIPIVTTNRIIGYKSTTLLQDIFTILGLNLFLKNPVYVISWFITFILLLYTSAYIINNQKTNIDKIATIVFLSLIFISINKFTYFIFFISSNIIGSIIKKYIYKDKLQYNTIQKIQPLCYMFFLTHGACVLLIYILFHNIYATFILGTMTSIFSAILLQHITQKATIYFPALSPKRMS